LLWVIGCLACFNVKDDKLNPRTKKFVFLGVKRNLKGYKLWDSKNKKIVLSRYVTFDEASLLKSIISQQVERTKTKDVSQWVKVDATPLSPVSSMSVGISSDVTHGGNCVAILNTEHVEDIEEDVELFAAIGTKLNP